MSVLPQQTTKQKFFVDTKRCACSNKSCVRSFAGCADLNLAGICWVSCRKFSDAVMMILSGQSVISRVYTSRFGNGYGSLGTPAEVVLKKYQVPGTVPSGKPPKSEPYHTVPYHAVEKRYYFLLASKLLAFLSKSAPSSSSWFVCHHRMQDSEYKSNGYN